MERALVKRLYRDESSRETVMLMESTLTKERIKIALPCQKAGILALEAHGLNDRCPLYSMFSRCVGEVGGVFGVVVINYEETLPASGAISLSHEGHTTWVDADVVELVAFALHARIPIYVNRPGVTDSQGETSTPGGSEIPSVFEAALEDILAPDAGSGSASADSSD